MPGIIEFPKVVQDALVDYGDLFANECQRRHLGEYLTGLMVAERKTVLGINSEFAQTTDQSCLNRFLTSADWSVQALNERRLEELQKDQGLRTTFLRAFRDLIQYAQQVLVFPPRQEAATVDTFSFTVFFGLKQTQRYLAEPGQVLRAVTSPMALLVLAETDIQHPV